MPANLIEAAAELGDSAAMEARIPSALSGAWRSSARLGLGCLDSVHNDPSRAGARA